MIQYTLKEVQAHNKKQNLWIILDKKVYDVTSFINDHPGGQKVLLSLNGKDGAEQFNKENHSESAKKKKQSLYIGDLKDESKINLGMVIAAGIFILGIGSGLYFGIYKNTKTILKA